MEGAEPNQIVLVKGRNYRIFILYLKTMKAFAGAGLKFFPKLLLGPYKPSTKSVWENLDRGRKYRPTKLG